jgi:DNA-binding LytR/AlgR family response regulator
MSGRPIIESIARLEQGNQLLKFPSGKLAGGPVKLDRGSPSPSSLQSTAAPDALDRSTFARLQLARIAIKTKGRFLFVLLADIAAIEAKGNYIVLHHTSGSHILRESISMLEHHFGPCGFVRIHRSVLVNAASVEEIQPWSKGEYVLRVRGGRDYTVTRTYKHNLHRLATCWLGGDGFCPDRSSVAPDIPARACL